MSMWRVSYKRYRRGVPCLGIKLIEVSSQDNVAKRTLEKKEAPRAVPGQVTERNQVRER
jgi:hypothetical protein